MVYWSGPVVPCIQWRWLEAWPLPRKLFSGIELEPQALAKPVPIWVVKGQGLSPLGQPMGRQSLASPFPRPNTQGTPAQTSYPNRNLDAAVSGPFLASFGPFNFLVWPVTDFVLAPMVLPAPCNCQPLCETSRWGHSYTNRKWFLPFSSPLPSGSHLECLNKYCMAFWSPKPAHLASSSFTGRHSLPHTSKWRNRTPISWQALRKE